MCTSIYRRMRRMCNPMADEHKKKHIFKKKDDIPTILDQGARPLFRKYFEPKNNIP